MAIYVYGEMERQRMGEGEENTQIFCDIIMPQYKYKWKNKIKINGFYWCISCLSLFECWCHRHSIRSFHFLLFFCFVACWLHQCCRNILFLYHNFFFSLHLLRSPHFIIYIRSHPHNILAFIVFLVARLMLYNFIIFHSSSFVSKTRPFFHIVARIFCDACVCAGWIFFFSFLFCKIVKRDTDNVHTYEYIHEYRLKRATTVTLCIGLCPNHTTDDEKKRKKNTSPQTTTTVAAALTLFHRNLIAQIRCLRLMMIMYATVDGNAEYKISLRAILR